MDQLTLGNSAQTLRCAKLAYSTVYLHGSIGKLFFNVIIFFSVNDLTMLRKCVIFIVTVVAMATAKKCNMPPSLWCSSEQTAVNCGVGHTKCYDKRSNYKAMS